MCKYCELTEISKGEFRNERNLDPIIRVKDGSQIMSVYLNRYIAENDKVHNSSIELVQDVELNLYGVYQVKSKTIKIKYCPFCGEKL